MSATSDLQREPASSDAVASAERLIAIVRGLVAELRPGGAAPAVRLDSALERELGLDSLARAELLLRIEAEMGVALPERVLAEAETARDLLRELPRSTASGSPPRRAAAVAEVPALDLDAAGAAEAAPESAATLLAVLAWHAARHSQRPHLV